MNIGMSIKLALVKAGKNQRQLASEMGISERQVNKVANRKTASSQTIEKMAAIFGMKASDFIALGE